MRTQLNGILLWLTLLWPWMGKLLIDMEKYLIPDQTLSDLYIVPKFHGMLFSYIFPTSLFSPHHLPHYNLAVGHICHVVSALGVEQCAHSSSTHHLSYLGITWWFSWTDCNLFNNAGTTQPIRIVLPTISCKCTLCCGLDVSNAFHYGGCIGYPPFYCVFPPPPPSHTLELRSVI